MDTFTITLILLAVCTVMTAFVSGRKRDRCVGGLEGCHVVMERKDGKTVWGTLNTARTSLEFVYSSPYTGAKQKHLETSFIVYHNEFSDIFALARFVQDQTPEKKEKRDRVLAGTVNPPFYSGAIRKTRNFFGTVRDSIMELVTLVIGRVKTATPAGKVLTGQEKYLAQLQSQGLGALAMAYEPVLEKYIGKKVVLTVFRNGEKEEYPGILKDYTSEFIEVMDVDYKAADGTVKKADLVMPRSVGVVRHAGG